MIVLQTNANPQERLFFFKPLQKIAWCSIFNIQMFPHYINYSFKHFLPLFKKQNPKHILCLHQLAQITINPEPEHFATVDFFKFYLFFFYYHYFKFRFELVSISQFHQLQLLYVALLNHSPRLVEACKHV